MKVWYQKYQTVILLGVILLLGLSVRLYNLGQNSFVADEFLDINSSYGYTMTGEWRAWDFNYGVPATQNVNHARDERAAVYKWQVAQVLKILSPTEFSARLVSVMWGVLSLLCLFFASWYYTKSKEVGLIAAFLFAFAVSAIIFDRRLRMYAMFLPVYLAFATTLYAFLEEEYKGRFSWMKHLWERLGVNALFLIPTLILGTVSFLTHQITLSVVPAVGGYLLVMAIREWKRGNQRTKYSVLSALGIATVFLVVVTGLWSKVSYLFVFFDNHYSYLGYVFGDFAHPVLGAILVLLGAYFLIRQEETSRSGIWLTTALCIPLAMSIWLWHRNAGPQYIFFVQSFTLILAASGVEGLRKWWLMKEVDTKKVSVGVALLVILLLPNYSYFLEENNTYHETSSGGNPNYRKVFTYVKKNLEPDDVLVTRNFRNYYWSGAQVPVYDFGGELSEHNFRLEELRAIQAEHPQGWIVVSENDEDYLSKEVKDELKNMQKISNSQVRGAIAVYRWGVREKDKALE